MAAAPRRPAPQPSSTHAAQVKPNTYTPPGPMGNTVGLIVPDTETSPGANSAPAIVPTKKEESWWKRWGSDVTHGVLDVVGLIPVVGEIADGASALIYVAEGDYVNAAISAAAMIPGAGMAATGAKYGKKVIGAVVESAAKKAEREAAERAAKELAKKKAEKEAAEAAANANKGKKGGKDKGKKKLKCGQYGKYGDLKKQSGDNKFDRDHIPSKAALKERAQELLGPLNKKQLAAIEKAGEAIAIPKQAHIDVSPTYGQSTAGAAKDSKNLAGSARRDVDAMLKEIDKYDEDGKCKKAYQKAAAKVLRMNNADFDKMLIEIVTKVK